MNRDFKGDSILLEKYKEVTKDITSTYHKGTCLCFAGKHGLGKTMVTTNILKRAAEKGYTALYTNLSDIVSNLVARDSEDKAATRKELLTVDFLAIDEFDPRHMGQSNTATDLFGRTLEDVLRTRAQNNLPLFMCTNSPNVVESFVGDIKNSISSLMNYITIVPVLGKDFRKEELK